LQVRSIHCAQDSSRNAGKIDYGHDLLFIFRENCFGCGPSRQMGGLRLDERRAALLNLVGPTEVTAPHTVWEKSTAVP
jgi:hypothetical protein